MKKITAEAMLAEALAYTTRENRMPRSKAAQICGSDRAARKAIEYLRSKGSRICSDSEAPGYYLARTEEDYKRFRADYTSRAARIFENVKAMDNATPEGQETIPWSKGGNPEC